jgi:two-component system sensor histidine kinase CreC
MYVGAPIIMGDAIAGVVTVGKPVQSFGQFVQTARRKIVIAGIIVVIAFVLLAFIVSIWLVRPFGILADYVKYVRAQRQFSLPRLGRRAIGVIGAAYNEMRDALAGRHYVSEYVQTLTHEIKGPLSAIRGAAELLQEPMPDEARTRFLRNITRETQRIQELVDRLLELSALETRGGLDQVETVDLNKIVDDALQAAQPAAAQRDIVLSFTAAEATMLVEGNAFLLQRAVANLLDNAIDFSPASGRIDISLSAAARSVILVVRDYGVGIPEFAINKVFEKFYSLARPHTNRKGTGLGLAFVREITELHQGRVALGNAEGGGACATLELPRAS